MFGKDKIIKVIKIEGMSCGHCSKKVEDSLKEIKEVKKVKVFLEEKKAEIVLKQEVDNSILEKTIEEIGFKVIEII